MRIAIIGAGLAGLTLASRLTNHHDVTVFEKARGPGGRMSTRRADPYAFDHGAQYFTAETQAFRDFLKPLQARKLVETWPTQIELVGGARLSSKEKFVCAPGMNSLCKYLADGLDVRAQSHVEAITRSDNAWHLSGKTGLTEGPFDWVVSTAPSIQTAALMPGEFSGQAKLRDTKMVGCFALMLGFEAQLDLGWTALKSGTPPIGWMAVNSSKPDRPTPYALLIQSNNEWAEAHLEDDPEAVQAELIRAASKLAEIDLSVASHKKLHRWRYAATATSAGEPYLIDEKLSLAACGDWCLGGKVEAAFSSASALADHFASSLST